MVKEYKSPALAVNWIIEKNGKILLLKRNTKPFIGKWEIGGGFVNYGEKVEDALVREVKEETNLIVKPKEILGVYSEINRDPRKHVVSVCFVVDLIGGELRLNEENKDAKWFNINEIDFDNLAFDHNKIIKDYIKWKRNKRTYWSSKKGP